MTVRLAIVVPCYNEEEVSARDQSAAACAAYQAA